MPKAKILLISSNMALIETRILMEEGKEIYSPTLIKVAKVNIVATGVNRSSSYANLFGDDMFPF